MDRQTKCHKEEIPLKLTNVLMHSSTCFKNLIKFSVFYWHFNLCCALSVYQFYTHFLYQSTKLQNSLFLDCNALNKETKYLPHNFA